MTNEALPGRVRPAHPGHRGAHDTTHATPAPSSLRASQPSAAPDEWTTTIIIHYILPGRAFFILFIQLYTIRKRALPATIKT